MVEDLSHEVRLMVLSAEKSEQSSFRLSHQTMCQNRSAQVHHLGIGTLREVDPEEFYSSDRSLGGFCNGIFATIGLESRKKTAGLCRPNSIYPKVKDSVTYGLVLMLCPIHTEMLDSGQYKIPAFLTRIIHSHRSNTQEGMIGKGV